MGSNANFVESAESINADNLRKAAERAASPEAIREADRRQLQIEQGHLNARFSTYCGRVQVAAVGGASALAEAEKLIKEAEDRAHAAKVQGCGY